jgi:Novel toxin 10
MGIDPVGVDENNVHSHNRYAYANNNPYKFVDPDGRVAETVWDVANLAMGVSSFGMNLTEGNYVGAAVDVVGIVVDGAATAVPFIPGGAGAVIKSARAADNVVDSAKGAKQTGSYTIEFNDGMKYHGKGDEARMLKSIKEKSKLNESGLKGKDHTTAANNREAFKQEARRIEADDGVGNPKNYNKINSPGVKYRLQDGD